MLDVGGSGATGRSVVRSRQLGACALVVAVVAALALPRLLAPGVVGAASAAPLPPPPPVGSCLQLAIETVEVVGCDRPHTAEVLQTWPADRQPDGATALDGRPAPLEGEPYGSDAWFAQSVDMCWPAMDDYLAIPPLDATAVWIAIPVQIVPRFISAPAEQSAGKRRWRACVLTAPSGQEFVGTLRNAGAPDSLRPAPFGSCVWSGTGSVVGVVGCAGPHQIELLGYFNPTMAMFQAGSIETGMTAQDIQDSCTALASRMTRSADPTYGGRLRISARPLFNSLSGYVDAAGTAVSQLVVPDCFAELVGAGDLAGTVVGLGDGPLPLG